MGNGVSLIDGHIDEMTVERAIEILNPEHREHYESIEPVNEACRMGMKALEKQIPKKPKISRSTIGTMWGKAIKTKHFACPSCKTIFLFARNEVKGNCCKFCGQALDWSDTE